MDIHFPIQFMNTVGPYFAMFLIFMGFCGAPLGLFIFGLRVRNAYKRMKRKQEETIETPLDEQVPPPDISGDIPWSDINVPLPPGPPPPA